MMRYLVGIYLSLAIVIFILYGFNSLAKKTEVETTEVETTKCEAVEQRVIFDINQLYGKSIEEIRDILYSLDFLTVTEEEVKEEHEIVRYSVSTDLSEELADIYEDERMLLGFYYSQIDDGDEKVDSVYISPATVFSNPGIENLFKAFNLDSSKYKTHLFYDKIFISETEKVRRFKPVFYTDKEEGIKSIQFEFNDEEDVKETNTVYNLQEYNRTDEEKLEVEQFNDSMMNKLFTLSTDKFLNEVMSTEGWEVVKYNDKNAKFISYLNKNIPQSITDKYGFNALVILDYFENDRRLNIDFYRLNDEKNNFNYDRRMDTDIRAKFKYDEELLDMLGIEYEKNPDYDGNSSEVYKYSHGIREVWILDRIYGISEIEFK